jgi:hypothetical protein
MKFETPYGAENTKFSGDLLDFRNVLFLVWRALGLPEPTAIQYEVAKLLQYGVDPTRPPWEHPNNSLVICGFRSMAKSWIAGAFVPWYVGLDPHEHEVLVTSASSKKSDAFAGYVHQLLSLVDVYQHLVPAKPHRWSTTDFDVEGHRASQVASVRSRGIFGDIVGGRADLIIPDDVETPNTAETQGMREKLRDRVSEFSWVAKEGRCRTVYLGTPHFEDTLYTHLVRHDFTRVLIPARYPDRAWMRKSGHELRPLLKSNLEDDPSLAGTPTDPQRFGDDDLLRREAKSGRSKFALQMMLDTAPADAERRPLKVRDLIVADVNPEIAPQKLVWASSDEQVVRNLPNMAPDGDRFFRPLTFKMRDGKDVPMLEYQHSVLYVDPSGTGGDETAWCGMRHLNGTLFVSEISGSRAGYTDDTLEAIAQAAKRVKANAVVVESNFGQGMFMKLLVPFLKRVHPCAIEEVTSSRQKELRVIDTLEPLLNQHRLVVDPAVIEADHASIQDYGPGRECYSWVHQLTRVTRDRGCLKHDDRLEALAGAASFFTDMMAVEQEDAIRRRSEGEAECVVREYLAGFGAAEGEPVWSRRNSATGGARRPSVARGRGREPGGSAEIELMP